MTPTTPPAGLPAVANPNAPVLYVASLRPQQDAPDSTAYGTATLLLPPDGTVARVTVSYSNLTSALVSSHLKFGAPGAEGKYLKNFSGERQPVVFEWDLKPDGEMGATDLRKALQDGLIYVGIDTRNHSAGEIRGQFIRATGSATFTPPRPPPALPAGMPTPTDAARFLIQATFGPTRSEIDDLTKKSFAAWLDEQISIPPTSHLAATQADYRAYPPASPPANAANAKPGQNNRQIAWWKTALTGPDQLRQRVAFALSEIFVVSDVNSTLAGNAEALANYQDLLARHAFGNFRELLEDVTLSPVMASYLSLMRNAKADPAKNTSPDENYAREVMQLFTIGLNQLQPDGTLKLGPDGLPMPTYDQQTIGETSRLLTGWGFYTSGAQPNFRGARANFFEPMKLFPAFHDTGAKTIVGGVKVPAGQGGEKDMKLLLDTLFNHPNTGPFICRQLIQRLVTSNPSPAYVYRVAQVFANNGSGERGDLGAVTRAILTDYEARSPAVLGNAGYGKLKEPLLRATALLRGLGAASKDGRYNLTNMEAQLAQAPLRSPTVFNFFEPDYVLPGPLAAAGLRAPEYQIFTDTTAISVPNRLQAFIYTAAQPTDTTIVLNLDALLPLAKTPDALLDWLNLTFCSGSMSPATRERITKVLAEVPPATTDLDRVRSALHLTVTSMDAAIQR